ncbi:hypothetical protein A2U01_0028171, partial [Trifolium medium]|nr:hypothetical protein [Trifolium medium]
MHEDMHNNLVGPFKSEPSLDLSLVAGRNQGGVRFRSSWSTLLLVDSDADLCFSNEEIFCGHLLSHVSYSRV